MGRKPRFEYPGGVYHLIQRGNNRDFIFKGAEQKVQLLNLLLDNSKLMEFDVFGYVIMDNHYHLIIKLGNIPLSKIMHKINNTFSRNYNKEKNRTGHVFENRYKSILVVDDRYLLSLLRYIHNNPVLANVCDKVQDYYWSSDQYYRNNIANYINVDFILSIFSSDRLTAINAYVKFMDENVKENVAVFEQLESVGQANLEKIDEYFCVKKRPFHEILKDVTKNEKIYQEIKRGSRKRALTKYKKQYIEACVNEKYTLVEIGRSIQISDAAVYQILNSEF